MDSVSKLSVDVADYLLLDDPAYYHSHIFVLQVWIEQDLYEIQRSYVSFVELDQRLKRKYPRSNLPTMPLAGTKDKAFLKDKDGNGKSRRFSLLKGKNPHRDREKERDAASRESFSSRTSFGTESTRESEYGSALITGTGTSSSSISSSSARKRLIKRSDTNEVIGQKKSALTYYLRDLLKIPEVLMSSTLLYFLDEESTTGDAVEEEEDFLEYQEHKLILEEEKSIEKTVRKEFKITLFVDPGDVVVWSFATKHRDIGFCCWFDEKEVEEYPFQRYNAQEYTIYGLMEVVHKGKLELQWDNSYSKFHSKTLIYAVRVVDIDTLTHMRLKAKEIQDNKHEYQQKRKHLFRILQMMSTEALQISTTSAVQDALFAIGINSNNNNTNASTLDDEHSVSSDDPNVVKESANAIGSDELPVKAQTYGQANGPSVLPSMQSENDLDDVSSTNLHLISPLPVKGNHEKLIKELQEELFRLRNEKQFVQMAYTQCETALVAERSACAEKQQQCDDLMSKRFELEEELEELRSDLDSTRSELHELQSQYMSSAREAHRLPLDTLLSLTPLASGERVSPSGSTATTAAAVDVSPLLTRPEVMLANFQELLLFAREAQVRIQSTETQCATLEQQLSKAKGERKQLKQLGIQLKERAEAAEAKLFQCEHDRDLVVAQNNELREENYHFQSQYNRQLKSVVKSTPVSTAAAAATADDNWFAQRQLQRRKQLELVNQCMELNSTMESDLGALEVSVDMVERMNSANGSSESPPSSELCPPAELETANRGNNQMNNACTEEHDQQNVPEAVDNTISSTTVNSALRKPLSDEPEVIDRPTTLENTDTDSHNNNNNNAQPLFNINTVAHRMMDMIPNWEALRNTASGPGANNSTTSEEPVHLSPARTAKRHYVFYR